MKPGCYSGLRKPLPKELNLRLIFTLRPDFSEVCSSLRAVVGGEARRLDPSRPLFNCKMFLHLIVDSMGTPPRWSSVGRTLQKCDGGSALAVGRYPTYKDSKCEKTLMRLVYDFNYKNQDLLYELTAKSASKCASLLFNCK